MRRFLILTGVALLCLAVVLTFAGAKKKKKQDPMAGKDMPTAATAVPDQVAMPEEDMEAWMKYMMPGEEHKALAKRVGEWDAVVKYWMAPGTDPEASEGRSVMTSVMGGRYVLDNYSGTAMGQPFTGMGISGFDNMKKKFFFTWIDSMGTGVMTGWGTMDKDGGINYDYEMPNPMNAEPITGRSTEEWLDENTIRSRMYMDGHDGKEFMHMEITYSRSK